ncbi:hypothetical protein KR200_001019, partial [Drosophila serrata]
YDFNRKIFSQVVLSQFNVPSFLAVAVLAVILMSVGTAQGDEFTDTAREMKRIYGDPSVSKVTRQENLPHLAEFYEKYRGRIQLEKNVKHWADNILSTYKKNLVEGVLPQGGNVKNELESQVANITVITIQ